MGNYYLMATEFFSLGWKVWEVDRDDGGKSLWGKLILQQFTYKNVLKGKKKIYMIFVSPQQNLNIRTD